MSSVARPPVARVGFLVQAGLLAGPFMSMIDSSIVNVALPDVARSLHAALSAVQWVVSGYLLALGVALAGTAYLAKRFGTGPVYMASLGGFTLASALCAASPGIGALIAVRVLQGALGAPLVPLAMNMLFGEGADAAQLPAIAGMVLFLAPALAPALGGVLIHWSGWPTIFLVNVPVGVLALIGARRLPPALVPGPAAVRPPFDLPGFAGLGGGLALVTYGASVAVQRGWLSTAAWPYWVLGALLLAAYTVWALHAAQPIVDVRLLRPPQQALAMGLVAVVSVVTFALIVVVPTFLEASQGQTALTAGLVLVPQGLATGLGTVLGNAMPSRAGVRATVVAGMGVLLAATCGMLVVNRATPLPLLAALLSGRGFAIGLVIQPLLNRLIGRLPPEQVPDGNTLFNIVNRIAGAVGIALIVTMFAARARAGIAAAALVNRAALAHAGTAAFHDVIALTAGLSAAGLLLALGIGDGAVSRARAG